MNRPKGLLADLSQEDVPYRPLRDVGSFIRGNGIQKKDFTETGVGCIHYGQIHTHYGVWAKETLSFVSPLLAARLRHARTGDLVIATTSEDDEAVGKAVAWLGTDEVAVSSDALIFRHSLDPTFVAYFFQSEQFRTQKQRFISGTKVRRLSGENLGKIHIPVPSRDVQHEIVKVLDNFIALEAELEAELEARRRQYEYYRDALLLESDSDRLWMTLGDIGSVAMCKRIFKADTSSTGDVPFFKIGTFGGQPDSYIPYALFENYRARFAFPNPGDVLLSAAGTIGRAIPFNGGDAYFQDSNIVWLKHDESVVLNRYLFHWYQVCQWTTDGGTIRRLYNDNLLRARILVPSLDEQCRIVTILDQFDALVNDLSIGLPAELKARRQQYEYYRDRLLTFPEAA